MYVCATCTYVYVSLHAAALLPNEHPRALLLLLLLLLLSLRPAAVLCHATTCLLCIPCFAAHRLVRWRSLGGVMTRTGH